MSSIGQGVSRLLGYATQVALAWLYGPVQLGFYVLGVTLVQITNILSQFGMDNGVVRYVAHYQAEGDARRMRGTVLQALAVTFVLSVVLSSVLIGSHPILSYSGLPSYGERGSARAAILIVTPARMKK